MQQLPENEISGREEKRNVAKRGTRKQLNGTKRQSVGRATYLVANNIAAAAGNVLTKVHRPGK